MPSTLMKRMLWDCCSVPSNRTLLYPPNVTTLCNREVIRDRYQDRSPAGECAPGGGGRLRLAGCEKIFRISSYTGEGVPELLEFLKEDRDVLPWEEAKKQEDQYI